jgi:alkylhydroperoxidase family enzyme
MQRVQRISPESATGRTGEMLAGVRNAFGMVPNATTVMANSPAVLESFLALSSAMGGVSIGDKLHTQIKLSTSEANACSYCTSILCAIGPKAGLSASDLVESRAARSADPRTDAALKFAKTVLDTRGKVGGDDLAAVRRAGFGDPEIVEIVASVVAGCFTNFLNNVAETELDIPDVGPRMA